MSKYKLIDKGVRIPDENRSVPEDPNNRHWRIYLSWLDEGNTPDQIETTAEKKGRLMEELKTERKKLFDEVDKKLTKVDVWEDLTSDQKTKIKLYKQVLRDMPETHATVPNLENPNWPILEVATGTV